MSMRNSSKRGAPQIARNDIKRTREADDEDEREEDYGDMDDIDDFGIEEETPVTVADNCPAQDQILFPEEWKRAECPSVNMQEDFIFQQIEIDVCSGKPHPSMAKRTDPNEAPHIRLFGVTKDGHSVMARVHGFMPYFYTECPGVSIANQVRDISVVAFL